MPSARARADVESIESHWAIARQGCEGIPDEFATERAVSDRPFSVESWCRLVS
ncbi:hypothetical protein [Streptomyces sp. NPDC050546]|uniref:hypothetical protein n=1 Tax=Streptomyces sp. NPDC050546 TaxID=3365628 RepID=UPI0037B566F6